MSSQNRPEPLARYLRKEGQLVDQRITRLQSAITSPTHVSWVRAVLANLRTGIRREPGAMQEIWEWTSCDVDDHAKDEPTREEWAVHSAMCLYALHQQGKTDGMYQPGYGLGRAVHRLAGNDAGIDSPVRRRFARVLTAASIQEYLHHLRGLVTQMRSAQPAIPLDYAMLADDLVQLQRPGGPEKVRLRWSRQYYKTSIQQPSSEKENIK